jgi:hypothetical protein
MADGVRVDFSELDELVADFGKHLTATPQNVAKAVEVTARHVKDDWREPLSGSESLPGGAATVTYELKGAASLIAGRSAISAEIGPESRGQGPLVGMLEFGTPNTGPRGYGLEALRKNADDFERGIGKAVEDGI